MNLALFQHAILWEDPVANYDTVEQKLATLSADVDIIILP